MDSLKKTARTTGLWYLGLAVTGMLGFLLVRGRLLVDGDAAATATNLVDNETLARFGIAMMFGVVVTQALAALWFYRLYRGVDAFVAVSLTAFGFVNAIAILVGSVFSAAALDTALDASTAPAGDQASTALLLVELEGHAWGVGALFFGLWLIPMGVLAIRSGFMPRPLGWFLVAGGFGYMASAFVAYLAPDAPGAIESILVFPASVGEMWTIGYLLTIGIRQSHPVSEKASR
ncbi:MAG: DUF4386 domain-containing protein [Demequinaceae bacterium]|nr:DUF4386 domain-containing protein [Demequinaceae bacterium]